MDEVWVRAALVAGALGVAAGLAELLRRNRRRIQPVRSGALVPGVYLFTSSNCSTCRQARDKMIDALGSEGFREFTWEQDPLTFGEIGVDSVPAVLIVGRLGQGRLYPGQPDRALADL